MSSRRVLALLTPVLLVILSSPAFAQMGARLKVCNTGKVRVEVAVASDMTATVFTSEYWIIRPYSIDAGACALVYDEVGYERANCGMLREDKQLDCEEHSPPIEALVAFGFRDAAGGIVSLEATPPPDFGLYDASYSLRPRKVLAWDSRPLCVDERMRNRSRSQDSRLTDSCNTGYVALKASYDFYPDQAFCGGPLGPGLASLGCAGGDYSLNVAAVPANREIDVTYGDDSKPAPRDPAAEKADKAAQDALKKAFSDALEQAKADEEKRKEAADPINMAAANRKIYEARRDSIDYAAEHTRNIGRIRDLSEFSPAWLQIPDHVAYVRGTVSRVELPTGPRQPARLYFKESPDQAFVACIPVPQLWDTASLQQYAGKYLEVRGRVAQTNCGGKVADVQVGNPSMVLDLANGTPPDEEALPGMTVSPPPNKGGPAVWKPPTPGPDRNDRVNPAPRDAVPQPPPARAPSGSSTAAAATPAVRSRAAAPSVSSPIPAGTRMEVTLIQPVDMVHANNGDTFRAQVLRVSAPGGGNMPSPGAAVVLRFVRTPAAGANGIDTVSLTLQSVALNGQPVSVSSSAFTTAVPTTATPGATTTLRAGMRIFFIISGAR